ncbi:MAG: zf-HC2 domain-containing protein [Syntrophomonas sp.]
MSKYPCAVIQDLIPLYKEGIFSAQTEEIIREHLEECPQCRDLINDDYSQPVDTEIVETLPEADTFKRLSKRVRKWGLYSGLAILAIILTVGAVSFYMGRAESEPALSVRQAVNIFAKEGIHLIKINDPAAEEISGVKPVSFLINYTGNKLHIYRYDSIAERKTADEMWRENNQDKYFHSTTNGAKNMIFIIVPVDEKQITIEDLKLVGKVSKTVFEKLNETQEIVFTGAGENWESQTVVKYYEYFYYDEDGTLNYESYYKKSASLKYLGQDIESVGEISYEMQQGAGKGSGTGPFMSPDGTVSLGSSGGNGSIPRADQDITFTIRWNDQEETFVARSK